MNHEPPTVTIGYVRDEDAWHIYLEVDGIHPDRIYAEHRKRGAVIFINDDPMEERNDRTDRTT